MIITKFRFKKIYFLIFIIWLAGFIMRTYRQDQLLGFYFDQGRDAQMAQTILSGQDFPAIGPTTGIEGLFLGPFWYYLITPGYFLGNGHPAIAAVFISLLESLTIPAIYFFVARYHNQKSALLASFIWSFSYYLIRSSRWFSNPTPIPFFVISLMYCLTRVFIDKKPKYLIPFAFLLGLSLQLEAASAIFFIPVALVFAFTNLSSIKQIKIQNYLLSILAFCSTLIPQIAFEFKNNFLVSRNLLGFLTGKINSDSGQSWGIPTRQFVLNRLNTYYEVLFSKLDTNTTWVGVAFFIIFLIGLIFIIKRSKNDLFLRLNLLWLFIPLLLLLFFVGNYGVLYDYYLTGFFPPFIILFSISVFLVFRPKIIAFLATIILVALFLNVNFPFTKNYITAGTDGPTHVSLGNQLAAVRQVCQTTQPYNLSVYVPPQIPYTYDYLFDWISSKENCHLSDKRTDQKLLITLNEVDLQNPSLLVDWITAKDHFTSIDQIYHHGGIQLQYRLRQSQ